jgi:hypothetical protein
VLLAHILELVIVVRLLLSDTNFGLAALVLVLVHLLE